MTAEPEKDVIYAYEPDQTLRELIGQSTLLSDIFTEEKIEACQKRVDAARISFFTASQRDMEAIDKVAKSKALTDNCEEACREIFQPVSNIKGQAEVFGFSLIARICRYLIEYCESNPSRKSLTARDMFIVTKLIEALRRAFRSEERRVG